MIPDDELNRELLSHVRPPDWKNPRPTGRYNLVVLGAGSAGLIVAAVAAGLGARVALVERELIGGDCLNVGCVPSKALIRSARIVGEARRGASLGVNVGDVNVDFEAVMRRVRQVRTSIAPHDSAKRYQDELGVDVFLGNARFSGSDTVDVDGTELRFKRAVVTTGARAIAPPIPGLEDVGYLTNETVFTLVERPRRLAVIGAGPIGCELSQAFARLGSEVTVLELGPQIMGREDRDAAQIVERALVADGVRIELGAQTQRIERTPGGKRFVYTVDGQERTLEVDEILVGAGRKPNVDGLDLERVGVRYDERRGVEVDDRLRTSNPRIYAAGDICLAAKFTHMADASAKIVVQNALFYRRQKLSDLVVPWCTYTDPEVAHVGQYAEQARESGVEVDEYRVELGDNDRGKTEGDEGFLKVTTRRGSDQILGATVVAPHAGEMISEITLAITRKVGLGAFANVIHPYPTEAEMLKTAAGQYLRTRLTPTVAGLFRRFLAWTR